MSLRSEPTTWHAEAVCRKFDPTAWETPNNDKITAVNAEAIEICRGCPVRAACLAETLEVEKGTLAAGRWHIFGGLMPAERASLDSSPRRNKNMRAA